MTEFTHRNQPVAPGGSTTERVSAVRAVTPVAHPVSRGDASEGSRSPAGGFMQSGEEAARAFADYAKVNRDIASVVDSVGARPPGQTTEQAESALLSLLPQPGVILPMPPADEEMVAFVAQVAQSIARQAAQTRAALSGIVPTVVDAVIAA